MIQALAAASAYTTSAVPLSHHKRLMMRGWLERSTKAGSSAGELYRRPSKYRIKTIRRMVPIFPASSPRESATWLGLKADTEPESQRRAAALARSFLAQSARKSFISALSPRMRGATPLYFLVVPVIVRLTAP